MPRGQFSPHWDLSAAHRQNSDTGRTVSRENVEIVRRCYGALNDRDWSAASELLDPDFELDMSRNIFNPDVYHGRAGLERFARVVDDVWDDLHLVPTELIDAGDNVVAAVIVGGKGKESGVDVKMHVFDIWTLRDSKVVRVLGGYRDRSEALKGAGLPERAHSGSP
jgi:ketosteroid isomerase-like protein